MKILILKFTGNFLVENLKTNTFVWVSACHNKVIPLSDIDKEKLVENNPTEESEIIFGDAVLHKIRIISSARSFCQQQSLAS